MATMCKTKPSASLRFEITTTALKRLPQISLIHRDYAIQGFKKTGPFVVSSYRCFDSYELHENFRKYVGGITCCEYGINVCESLAILCK